MTATQEKHLKRAKHYLYCEGLDMTDNEEQNIIDIFNGKRTYKDVLAQYIAEASQYAGA